MTCTAFAHLVDEPCYDCYLYERHQAEERAEQARRETESGPPACLQIPLPDLEALASLPF